MGFEELLLLVLGFALILIEAFAIPGFGIVGILGICSMLAALVLALVGHAPSAADISVAMYMLGSSLVAAIIGAIILFRFVERSPMWMRVKLATTQDADLGWVASDVREDLVGQRGVAATDLRPAGAATFAGRRYDVVSEAEFIERGAEVEVLKHEGYRIVVREVSDDTAAT